MFPIFLFNHRFYTILLVLLFRHSLTGEVHAFVWTLAIFWKTKYSSAANDSGIKVMTLSRYPKLVFESKSLCITGPTRHDFVWRPKPHLASIHSGAEEAWYHQTDPFLSLSGLDADRSHWQPPRPGALISWVHHRRHPGIPNVVRPSPKRASILPTLENLLACSIRFFTCRGRPHGVAIRLLSNMRNDSNCVRGNEIWKRFLDKKWVWSISMLCSCWLSVKLGIPFQFTCNRFS